MPINVYTQLAVLEIGSSTPEVGDMFWGTDSYGQYGEWKITFVECTPEETFRHILTCENKGITATFYTRH